MKLTRLRSSRAALFPIFLLVAAVIFWPTVDSLQRQTTSAQSVSWLGPDSTSYLTSASGIPVWVPSWLPSPVAGMSPEIYAGGGSYSIYFYSGGSFLYITGVAGAGFPGGSEANLNVELTVNASVAGYPAIHDLGIPEGSETPIYDKVMWIADGVLYTVNGNGLDSGSMALANSSVVLQPPAAPAPTSPPAVQQPPVETGGQNTGVTDPAPINSNSSSGSSNSGSQSSTNTSSSGSGTTSGTNQTSTEPGTSGVVDEASETPESAGNGDDGTGGPWYTGHGVSDMPSDGTAGPIPPRISPDDGTSGAP